MKICVPFLHFICAFCFCIFFVSAFSAFLAFLCSPRSRFIIIFDKIGDNQYGESYKIGNKQ